jgi:hypothetical protein
MCLRLDLQVASERWGQSFRLWLHIVVILLVVRAMFSTRAMLAVRKAFQCIQLESQKFHGMFHPQSSMVSLQQDVELP